MKYVPTRFCCGCRQRRPKTELLRFGTAADGILRWDESMKLTGRGAYVCRNLNCLRTAVKRGAFDRTLHRSGLRWNEDEMQNLFLALGCYSKGNSGEMVHGENLGR